MLEEPSSPDPGTVAEREKPAMDLDPVKVEKLRRRLEDEQALLPAVLGGTAAALAGAGIWAAITVATEYQIGWMAVAVGCLVGVTVRLLGKGTTNTFGVFGAGLSLFGCLLGNLLSACGFISTQEDVPFWQVVSLLDPGMVVEIMKVTSEPMDLLFYAIAVYEGYRFSFRRLTPEELQSLIEEEKASAE